MDRDSINVHARLDEIDQRVMAGLTPFQRATVEHIASIYADEGRQQRRVLVADEVGLGKTLIARGVISKIAKLRAQEGDDLVKIAYICSNGAIAAQNVAKLAIDGDVKLAPPDASRLTMQHLAVARERGDSELRKRYIQITPLTPSTSFSVTSGAGTLYERALMLAVLAYNPLFNEASDRHEMLANLMWANNSGYSESNWDWWKWRAAGEVAEARKGDSLCGENTGYPYDVLEKVSIELDRDGGTTLASIASYLDADEFDKDVERQIIVDLRKAFAKACVDMLEPDFVIMDEFQRFRELVADSDSETALLAKRFFNATGETRVLLLSATPFRLFSTTAELDAGGLGDSYSEFREVMGFLNEGNDMREREFQQVWGAYTLSVQQLSGGLCDVVAIRHAKSQAEALVRGSMTRTERQSTGELGAIADNHEHVRQLDVTAGDIQTYVKMRQLAEDAGIPRGLMQADFVKSCPLPLSFMARYKFFDKLRAELAMRPELVKADKKHDGGLLWLRRWDIASYAKLNVNNARYDALMHDLAGQSGLKLEQLLWVPPNRPYYQVPQISPFARAQGFSKFLLFSAWSMVPPALATLLSYEFERRNVRTLEAVTGHSYRYFKDGESGFADEERDEQALPHRRIRFDSTQRNAFLILYPSRYLAGLIDVPALMNANVSLNELRRLLRKRVSADLVDAFGVKRLPKASEASARRSVDWYILAALKLDEAHGHDVMGELLGDDELGGYRMQDRYRVESRVLESIARQYADWRPENLDGYPIDLVDVLVDAAIGSPAVCSMRCYTGVQEGASAKLAFEFGHAFVNRMNTASSTLAVAAAMESRGKNSIHWKNMLAYGCEGNMQAMIDEYAYVCRPVQSELSEQEVLRRMHEAMVGGGADPSLHLCETRHIALAPNSAHAKERLGQIVLRTNIASAFMESRSGKGDSNVVSRVRLRNAFNSPFRPFVLVSTSVGQEGLDFHSYCRKICHWNLPSNPVDLEQREGRVNRYKGMAVRQSIARRYGDMVFGRGSIWAQLFQMAERDEVVQGAACGASGLLPNWGVTEGDGMVKVERYVYLYPFSRDELRYKRLIADVFRYRAVMGMPDQEELLHMLEECVVAGEISDADLRDLFVNLCPYTWRDSKGDDVAQVD